MSNPFAQRHAELIDNRFSRDKKLTPSIIDSYTSKLRVQLNDPTLDRRFVAKALQQLSESDINDFADYCARKANKPGHAFVKLCVKTMQYKSLDK